MAISKKEKIIESPEDLPIITKNEVIQGTDFYKEIKKYEQKESFNPWLIIAIILVIICTFLYLL
jgi:uncharacterized membrane protein YidH (DUF202 family)